MKKWFLFLVVIFLVGCVSAEVFGECEFVGSDDYDCEAGLVKEMGLFDDIVSWTCVRPDDSSWCDEDFVGAYRESLCGDGVCQNGSLGDSYFEDSVSCPVDCGNFSGCTEDLKICENGLTLERDPMNNCEFPDCPVKVCVDLCGDGVCDEVVCQGTSCPCAEGIENCPEDCLDEGMNYKFIIWIAVAIVFLIIGFKILKWLFWGLAILAVILAIVWFFVL